MRCYYFCDEEDRDFGVGVFTAGVVCFEKLKNVCCYCLRDEELCTFGSSAGFFLKLNSPDVNNSS